MGSKTPIAEAFIANLKEHEAILHKICLVYSRNETDKKDLYQEITLQLWKSYPSFKGKSKFSTWMYRVALNTALTMKRRERENSQPVPAIPSYDPGKAMDKTEDIRILYKAIAQLRDVEKAIVLLWLEEKTYEEIAETIGISVKNVGVKMVRIKRNLASIIEQLQ